jgi:basic membrane lipoprotein Med (substrate-binding protein (PBP1-ABC) superfamily)
VKKPSSGQAGQATKRVLELSVDAQMTRRETPKDSPAFHSLTGAIAAYGKTLVILTALQQSEEFYSIIAQYELSEQSVAAS